PRGTGAADAEESESGRAGWPPAVSFSSLTVVLSSTLPDHRDGGRGDRTRTCNLRFWRPLLCQLSYAPSVTVPTCDTVTTVGSATPGHRRPRSSSVLHDRPGSQSAVARPVRSGQRHRGGGATEQLRAVACGRGRQRPGARTRVRGR